MLPLRQFPWVRYEPPRTNMIGMSIFASTSVSATVYALFSVLDGHVRSSAKEDIALYLLTREKISVKISTVSKFINYMFEVIFTKTQWSTKCFRRSCIVSGVLVILIGASLTTTRNLWDVTLFAFVQKPFISLLFTFFLIILFVLFSTIPDYLSIWKGRLIIRNIQGSDSLGYIISMFLVDVFMSGFIFATYSELFILLTTFGPSIIFSNHIDLHSYSLKAYLLGILIPGMSVFTMIFHHSDKISPMQTFGCFLLAIIASTQFTSIWMFGVACGSLAARLASKIDFLLPFIIRTMDIEEKPIKFIGLIISIILWILIVFIAII